MTIENVSAEAAKTAHIKIDRNRNPILIEIKDLPQFATASVEVPRAAGLAVSMLTGELQIRDIDGDKLCLLRSGKMLISVGDPQAYRFVRAFVFAGDIHAPAFKRDTGGVGRMMTWTGSGQFVIDAHVSTGLRSCGSPSSVCSADSCRKIAISLIIRLKTCNRLVTAVDFNS